MKNSQKIGFLGALLLIVSCSTKKDAFLNRNYNALTTQYNILYNGGVAFNEGLQEINASYEDDFFELLPIEPLTFKNKKFRLPKLSSSSSNKPGKGFQESPEQEESLTPFDIAEQKAVHMAQGGRRFYLKRWIKGNIDRIHGTTNQKNKAAQKAVALIQAEECFAVRGAYCSPRDSFVCSVCQQVFKVE